MRVLTLVVVLIAIVVVGAEVLVPPRLEGAIEDRVAQRVPEAGSVSAELDSFPVVARGLATGQVQRLIVTLDEVAHPDVTVSSVEIDVNGIEVSRRAIVEGELDLERVDRATLTAMVSEDDLEEALTGGNVDLRLRPGRVEATLAGQTVGSDVTVAEGRVIFDLGPLPDARVSLPGPELFPCPLEGEAVEGALRLTCTLEQLPDYLLERFEGAWASMAG